MAKYIYALKSLCNRGLAENDDGDLYSLTSPGFEVAVKLKQREQSLIPSLVSDATNNTAKQTANLTASRISNTVYPPSITSQVATQWLKEFLTPVVDLLGEINKKFNQNDFAVECLRTEPNSTAYMYRIDFFQKERWGQLLSNDVGEYFLTNFPQVEEVLVSFEKSMDDFYQALNKLEISIADSPFFLNQLKDIYARLVERERIPRSQFEHFKLQEIATHLLGQMRLEISKHPTEGKDNLVRFTAYTLLELNINFKPNALTEDQQLFYFCRDISNELRGKDESVSKSLEETKQLFDSIKGESSTLHQQLKREKIEIARRYNATF